MGSSASKPATGQASEHVFAAETPVGFSQDLIQSLQNSPETDSTREKSLELHIQSRVASELQRLKDRESQLLSELSEQISVEASSPSSPEHEQQQQPQDESPSSPAVHASLASLRSKLDSRPKLNAVDEGVERAKGEVVRCLVEKGGRPLDCWGEVEAFRREVGRLGRRFVERVVG